MEISSIQDNDEHKKRIQELVEDVAQRRAAGEEITDDQVITQHPDLMPELKDKLLALRQIADALEQSDYNSTDHYAPSDQIVHFRVERVLGQGHFGTVYLARDENLDRRVAIKVLRPERLAETHRIEDYIEEARRIANLDPARGIVPVYQHVKLLKI